MVKIRDSTGKFTSISEEMDEILSEKLQIQREI
jgi:hypothetical protein